MCATCGRVPTDNIEEIRDTGDGGYVPHISSDLWVKSITSWIAEAVRPVLTMGKPSWVRTVITQLSLCLAVLLAFNLGRPWEKPMSHSSSGSSRPLDLYFISVRGGFRPLNQQTHLLKQVYFSSSLLIPFVHWRKAWVFLVLYGFCFKMLMVGIFGFGSVGGYGSFIRRSVWLLRMLKVKSLEINFLFFPLSKLTKQPKLR